MASVYILHSVQIDRFYIGSCRDLSYRMDQHLSKEFKTSFTAKADDWTLFFFIDDLEYMQARSVELHIKAMKSKAYIRNLKKYPELVAKLIDRYK